MLFICPTPIGNLEDITLRVLRVLGEADLILAEDTRRTGQLLRHYKINKPLDSFHEHNEKEKTQSVLGLLEQGKKIALVSNAGMPGISDPGAWLIRETIDRNLPLEVLPGANAALLGFLQSGFLAPHFLYYGFLPRRKRQRQQALASLKEFEFPIIFYEAPHRLLAMLEDAKEVLGNRPVSVSRELTKLFEETQRGTLEEMIEFFRVQAPRGEFVVTVAEGDTSGAERTEEDLVKELKQMMDRGLTRKTAVHQISKKYNLPKNRIYEISLQINVGD